MYFTIVDEGLLKAEQLGVFLSEAGKPTYSIELRSCHMPRVSWRSVPKGVSW
jgi:hypothetical protein